MDHADIASETIEYCQAEALRRTLGKGWKRPRPGFDGHHCVNDDCGVEIPAGRLATGADDCIDCARAAEARQTMQSHNIRITDD